MIGYDHAALPQCLFLKAFLLLHVAVSKLQYHEALMRRVCVQGLKATAGMRNFELVNWKWLEYKKGKKSEMV